MWRFAVLGVRIGLLLCVCQAVILFGLKVAYGNEPEDFLAPYAEVMPGQSLTVFTPKWCATYEEYDADSRVRVCHPHLAHSPFTAVSIYFRGYRIQQLTFRAAGLYLGDLMQQWGRPTIEFAGDINYARWKLANYLISAPIEHGKRLSLMLPINSLAVNRADVAANSGQ
ncbi:MAG: hypothetical protein U0528_13980 [Anaerolineae bacterium]